MTHQLLNYSITVFHIKRAIKKYVYFFTAFLLFTIFLILFNFFY